jgi:catechol 2,3-dioxygenase-like lactoylglutathione lyase family enzyme
MIRKVDRLILRVPSLDAAARYYGETMGLRLVRKEKAVAIFRLPDDVTELVLHSDPDQPAEAVYLLVDDVRELYRRRDELKLHFQSPPRQVSRGFSATVRDPFGTVLNLLDRTTGDQTIFEDAKSSDVLFPGVENRAPVKRQELIELYEQVGVTADDLPYTPQFEKLHHAYAKAQSDSKLAKHETWRHLLNLRKAGKLPKLGESRFIAPAVEPEDEQKLREMLGEDIGKRDRLPYTPRFDQIVNEFNARMKKPLSPHQVWRLVAKIAK